MKSNNYEAFWSLIQTLSKADVLRNMMFIGSWAEYIYGHCGILTGFAPNLRTLDIDILIPNVRKPFPPINMVKQLEEQGYLISEECLEGITRIFTPDQMEVKFLVSQMGSGLHSSLKTNLGVTAQAIRNLSILKNNKITVFWHDYQINVPAPEAYVLQKIIINKNRQQKAAKDLESIRNLAPFLNRGKTKEILMQLTKKEHKLVRDFVEGNSDIPIFD